MSDDKEIKLLRKWVRNNDPSFKKHRKEYNEQERVRIQRKKIAKRRRHTISALNSVIKKEKLLTEDGKTYQIKKGRLVEVNDKHHYVIRSDKKGNIHRLEYEKEDDLEDDRYDMPFVEADKVKLYKSVKKLLDGDANLEQALSRKAVIQFENIPTEGLYWKQMGDKEKAELLSKLKNIDVDE